MGGFSFDMSHVPTELEERLLPRDLDQVTLKPSGLCFLGEHEPSLVPDVSIEEINDKSKANSLTKGIACVQATWFIAQCMFRLAQGLSISLLELNTFVHSLCALLIYGLWWDKPLDILVPTVLSEGFTVLARNDTFLFKSHPSLEIDRIRNWPETDLNSYNKSDRVVFSAFTLAGLLYGGFHLLAWNAPFVSSVERTLWQLSASSVAGAGPFFVISCILFRWLDHQPEDVWDAWWSWILRDSIKLFVYLITLLYLFARTYLVVESFLSLAYLPAAVFEQPQWTYYFPHII